MKDENKRKEMNLFAFEENWFDNRKEIGVMWSMGEILVRLARLSGINVKKQSFQKIL